MTSIAQNARSIDEWNLILHQSVSLHRRLLEDAMVQVSWSETWDSFLSSTLMRYADYNNVFVSTPLSTGHRIIQSKRVPVNFSMSLFGESRLNPMTGSSKLCEICDITNGEGVVRVAKCTGSDNRSRLTAIENYARVYTTIETNSQVFGQPLNFIITPTLYRYYLNHMMLIPTVHINNHAMMYNYTLFRSLIKVMDLIQSRSTNSLNFIFNGVMGSDAGHSHLHITDQKITYIDNDRSNEGLNHHVGSVSYSCFVTGKTNYEVLFNFASIIYNWQIKELITPGQSGYVIGMVFKIVGDKCKIYATKGRRFSNDQKVLFLPHTQTCIPLDTWNDTAVKENRSSIEQKIHPSLYMLIDTNNLTPYEEYPDMSYWHHTFIIDIHRSLSGADSATYCNHISQMLKIAYSKRNVATYQTVWKDLYPYLLNNLVKCPADNTRLETALVNLNMEYYNKLFKDRNSIYLDGALATRLFGNLDNILRTVAQDPDLVYSLGNTRIGDESVYGVIRPATVKDNGNYSVIVKMARHTTDVNSQQLFENSYNVGIVLNKVREYIPQLYVDSREGGL